MFFILIYRERLFFQYNTANDPYIEFYNLFWVLKIAWRGGGKDTPRRLEI